MWHDGGHAPPVLPRPPRTAVPGPRHRPGAAEVERTLGVSQRTQRRWAQRLAAGAALAPPPPPGRVRTITETGEADLRAQVAADPDATLATHGAAWAAAGNAAVSPATMSRALARLKLPLKTRR